MHQRRLLAAAALGLIGIGFLALALDGFPTIVPAVVPLGLAVAVRGTTGGPEPRSRSPR